jgi:hypothetical protein
MGPSAVSRIGAATCDDRRASLRARRRGGTAGFRGLALELASVSRVVQQFDVLKLSGRKQDQDHVLRTLELCQAFGSGGNVNLIFGWP